MSLKRPPNLDSSHSIEKVKIEEKLEKRLDNLKATFSYQIKDKDGNVIEDSGEKECHSFVKQFAQLLYVIGFYCGAGAPPTVTTTAGVSVTTLAGMIGGFRTDAAVSTDTYGIQVGTSTAAESINDTALGTKIAHGTGSGQLQYGAMSYGAPSTTATTTTFRFTRVFTNGSGASIGVEEFGLVSNSTTSNKFLLLRDLTGTITVTNGQALTLNLDFTTTI